MGHQEVESHKASLFEAWVPFKRYIVRKCQSQETYFLPSIQQVPPSFSSLHTHSTWTALNDDSESLILWPLVQFKDEPHKESVVLKCLWVGSTLLGDWGRV